MAQKEPIIQGTRKVERLKRFIDIVYALIFFNMFLYLPSAEDLIWKDLPYGLLSLLLDHSKDLLRILIGVGLTMMYWNQNNKLFKHLRYTNSKHTILSIVQLIFVCLFVYFAISDPELKGGPSSPALQAFSLAVAGFLGVWAWHIAMKNNLLDEQTEYFEAKKIKNESMVEPLTALFNVPVAWLGPMAWSIGWFAIPLVVIYVNKMVRRIRH